MGPIPPDMPMDELDRRMLEISKARRAANPNPRSYTSERIRKLIADLQARCEQAGRADPDIAEQLLAEMRAES